MSDPQLSDIQATLEKKRQRLLELKQRRKDLGPVVNTAALEEKQPPKKVDFAVQVDLPIHETFQLPSAPQPSNGSVLHFDKAVQTHFEDYDEESPKEKEENPEEMAPVKPEVQIAEPSPQEIVQNSLEDQLTLSSLNIKFSNLRLGIKDQIGAVETKAPFNSIDGLTGFLDRPVVCLDTSPMFPELLLVGYSKPSVTKVRAAPQAHLTSSAGLIIIYNRNMTPMVPEFFLQCTCGITTAQFDKTDLFRILAGLENGRVVMWDLTRVKPTQIAVLPTLQTTTIASITEKSQHRYIHHTAPIVLIEQLDSDNSSSLVSVSADGVINTWSPNLLAFPKLDSVRILGKTGRLTMKDQIRVSCVLSLRHAQKTAENDNSLHAPEYRFLNNTVLGSPSGAIYKLLNNKDKSFLVRNIEKDDTPQIASVSAMAELAVGTSSLIVSAYLDWHIRLWDDSASSPILSIPTSTLVTGIYIRPQHALQMVTVGCVSPPDVGARIDFWDLLARSMSPVSSIPLQVDGKVSIAASFSEDGSQLIIGFGNGDISIWEIDEIKLQAQIESSTNSSIDEGILPILKRF